MAGNLWKRIDIVENPPSYLVPEDICFYARDYIPGVDWVGDCSGAAIAGNWCEELKDTTCSGSTCNLINVWTVTDDDLGHWWYAMNAYDEEGNAGEEKGRCSGNPNGAIAPNPPVNGWSDCGNLSRCKWHRLAARNLFVPGKQFPPAVFGYKIDTVRRRILPVVRMVRAVGDDEFFFT